MLHKLRSHLDHTVSNEVFCVYLDFDGTRAAQWRLVALFVSMLGGLGAGFGSKNAQLGLDVGTAMLAIFMVLQGSLILVESRN